MVKKIDKLKSAKRFGTRYGPRNKEKFAIAEIEQRRLHTCPFCKKDKVKRLSAGIWECKKCAAKFAGKAYSAQ
ncbi:MAG: 50S ribosomal protein L37ae [Candidatus Woesearchaeota archaeon]|jgi:large subunit ribosomal protein L37Ae